MKVLRIVPDFSSPDMRGLARFYREMFDLEVAMDLDWIVTLASDAETRPQVTIGGEGGQGQPMPAVSIEVDDVDEAFRRASAAGHPISYPLSDEPWGVRRFFVEDPAGRVLNVLEHRS